MKGQNWPGLADEKSTLVEYLKQRADDIGELLARRYREDIVEYRSLPEGFIEQDVAPTARRNLEVMLHCIESSEELTSDQLLPFRESAIRRFRQGVPIQALLHAYRLWGHTVWEEVLAAPQTHENPESALALAGMIMKHVDLVSTAVAQSYLSEAAGLIHDREMGRRDLLEALVNGNVPRISRHAKLHRLEMTGRYQVLLLRWAAGSAAASELLRDSLKIVTARLSEPPLRLALVGVRNEEIVAIQELHAPTGDRFRARLNDLAAALPNFVLGAGRPHDGLAGVARGYVEAQNAIASAPLHKSEPRAYLYSDTLLDHLVRTSAFREDLAEETVTPLRNHDAARHTSLLATLRAYVRADFKLVQAAEALRVQPNTVKYRLQKIQEITGHDPFNAEDLTLLALSLRLQDTEDQLDVH